MSHFENEKALQYGAFSSTMGKESQKAPGSTGMQSMLIFMGWVYLFWISGIVFLSNVGQWSSILGLDE